MILKLKKSNEFIVYKHFKIESFNNALCMVTPNCYMGTIDLKDAYYTVQISNSETLCGSFETGSFGNTHV